MTESMHFWTPVRTRPPLAAMPFEFGFFFSILIVSEEAPSIRPPYSLKTSPRFLFGEGGSWRCESPRVWTVREVPGDGGFDREGKRGEECPCRSEFFKSRSLGFEKPRYKDFVEATEGGSSTSKMAIYTPPRSSNAPFPAHLCVRISSRPA